MGNDCKSGLNQVNNCCTKEVYNSSSSCGEKEQRVCVDGER